ncbi:c-type cytochrome [Cupriavidus numazuensis]|uniref:Cytochrome c6 n=1 Tax=Cupriavidus numazuensis TaxID=221992 RepID=A0ABM8TKR1_9BURK|nr:cytochrome c [Cupriavidus numazuensis]CAG2152315.1 Cytochrome c6 [Cupriavidus numazuensis]
MKRMTFTARATAAMLLALGMTGAMAQDMSAGKAVFSSNCAVCHQAAGQGQDGLAPALTTYPGRYASTEAGRKLLAHVVLNGMVGAIENGGKQYNGNMPNFRALSDAELADVLNYIATGLSGASAGGSQPFTADEVKAGRAQSLTPAEVRRQRADVVREAGL